MKNRLWEWTQPASHECLAPVGHDFDSHDVCVGFFFFGSLLVVVHKRHGKNLAQTMSSSSSGSCWQAEEKPKSHPSLPLLGQIIPEQRSS